MKALLKTSLATAILLSLGSVSAQASDGGTPIMDNIKVSGELRPRYENVDDSNNATSNANAITNRLVIGVKADLFGTAWLSGFAEMTDVHNVNNNYNSTDNGQGGLSVVADPSQTRITQSYLDFTAGKTLFRAGRQIVNLDNLRFIGSVNWRQMPQSFDAYALVDNSVDNLNLLAAYVTQVNTIKAGTSNSFTTSTALFHAKYKVSDAINVTGYGYLIGSVHDTYGLALTGKTGMSGTKLSYRVEYALQNDASMETQSQGKPSADADYVNLKLDANMSGILAGAMYEVLSGTNGSDNKTAFSTPLATLHGQNGWADNFLSTPPQGLVDLNVTLGYKAKGFGLAKAIYHDFSSDVGSTNYGTEFDLLYKNAVPGLKNLNGLVKAALYSGGDSVASGNTAKLATDKTVFWVMLDYKFGS
jgi:hypothetical protein